MRLIYMLALNQEYRSNKGIGKVLWSPLLHQMQYPTKSLSVYLLLLNDCR